ncbi:MAG: DoxX family protein [Marivirga sp.]|nr:DoxX family protein [Marivirga sp.]
MYSAILMYSAIEWIANISKLVPSNKKYLKQVKNKSEMNTAIWIIQGILAAFFLMPAKMKLISSKQKLIDKKQIEPDGKILPIRIIGLAELLGVFGIIIPYLTGILPILTPLAAIGFSMVMVGAVVVHLKKKEFKVLPLLAVIFILSSMVAFYRF